MSPSLCLIIDGSVSGISLALILSDEIWAPSMRSLGRGAVGDEAASTENLLRSAPTGSLRGAVGDEAISPLNGDCFAVLAMTAFCHEDLDGLVCNDGNLVHSKNLAHPKSKAWQAVGRAYEGSKDLSSLVAEGLASFGAQMQDIRYMLISCGPGSFTGIKIALSWAQGVYLANKHKIAVFSYSALAETLAEIRRRGLVEEDALLMFPSTRKSGFLAFFKASAYELDTIELSDAEEVHKKLAPFSSFVIVGPWMEASALLSQLAPKPIQQLEIPLTEFSRMALEGAFSLLRNLGPGVFDSTFPSPLYLKKSAAEMRIK
ncbi:MAG: hypothetical protein KA436_01180 [Oligoflexales bacterium]|nr:hypothetical protein [Oligoflexales bacterium]